MTKPRRNQPERELQRAVVEALDLAGIFFTHIANQRRDAIEAKQLKGMGVKAGVPDLLFPLDCGRVGFVELKAKGGSVTKAQRGFIEELDKRGHLVAVCRTVDGVFETLRAWGVKGAFRVAIR